jgi:transcriptional regulator with XRE-family HTH domain
MKPLGELLRDWRELLKLNQSEAARRCGMSSQHWGLIERGERVNLSFKTYRKLAEATGIPLERLMRAAELADERRHSGPGVPIPA